LHLPQAALLCCASSCAHICLPPASACSAAAWRGGGQAALRWRWAALAYPPWAWAAGGVNAHMLSVWRTIPCLYRRLQRQHQQKRFASAGALAASYLNGYRKKLLPRSAPCWHHKRNAGACCEMTA